MDEGMSRPRGGDCDACESAEKHWAESGWREEQQEDKLDRKDAPLLSAGVLT